MDVSWRILSSLLARERVFLFSFVCSLAWFSVSSSLLLWFDVKNFARMPNTFQFIVYCATSDQHTRARARHTYREIEKKRAAHTHARTYYTYVIREHFLFMFILGFLHLAKTLRPNCFCAAAAAAFVAAMRCSHSQFDYSCNFDMFFSRRWCFCCLIFLNCRQISWLLLPFSHSLSRGKTEQSSL